MKNVQHPRGTTAAENNVVGSQGQIRVDTDRNDIRLHDGVTVGGHRIPNTAGVKQMLTSGIDGQVGVLQVYATEAAMIASVPVANSLSIVSEAGVEDAYVWRSGSATAGTTSSAVDGHYVRLESAAGLIIRLWRAGMCDLQIDGIEPTTAQATTVWLSLGAIMLWDGTAYLDATPALFARLWASIGGYNTGSTSLPDRVAEVAVETANVDAFLQSGWALTKTDDVNSPLAGVHPVHYTGTTVRGVQVVIVNTTQTGDMYVRTRRTSVWDAWVLVPGQPDGRLGATSLLIADADLGLESGFYQLAGAAANIPIAAAGVMIAQRLDANNVTQRFSPLSGTQSYVRRRVGGTFGTWGIDGTPATAVVDFYCSSAPLGWLDADGSDVSRTTYATLWVAMGSPNTGDGATTFTLPDLRGEFVRGLDLGRGVDAARALGSSQASQNLSHDHGGATSASGAHTPTGSTASAGTHTHSLTGAQANYGGSNRPQIAKSDSSLITAYTDAAGAHTHTLSMNAVAAHTHTIPSSGGTEARPRNIALRKCIKY